MYVCKMPATIQSVKRNNEILTICLDIFIVFNRLFNMS